jgi:methionine sulfoxide reductase heme-binding subunit
VKKSAFTPLRAAVHVGAWLPLTWLVWAYWNDRLTINPIQTATQRSGDFAIYLLILSLVCTPLNTLFGWRQALTVRRALGMYAFMYACIHVFLYVGVDYQFNWQFLKPDFTEKPYIWVGLATASILLPLAVTSYRWWMKYLGQTWKKLHRLVYFAATLAVLHFAWAKKGDLLRLRGDIQQPLLLGIILVVLLIARIPVVRKWLSGRRLQVQRIFRQAGARHI